MITKLLILLGLVTANHCQVVPRGRADMVAGSSPTVCGSLTITPQQDAGVLIQGTINGLTPGLHGFHIHQKGSLGNACKDAGGHFNPFNHHHGHPQDRNRHVGDLGNILADPSGNAVIDIYDQMASLNPSSEAYIGNRAFVVHAKADDLGRGNNDESLKTGNAGSRVGCGTIYLEQPQKEPLNLYLTPTNNQKKVLVQPFGQAQIFFPNQGPALVPVASNLYPSLTQQLPSAFYPQGPLRPLVQGSQTSTNFQVHKSASVNIVPGSSKSVTGELEIEEVKGGVIIKGYIGGLKTGLHGFHIHEIGDLGNECRNAKGHFNPFEVKHGDPKDRDRHVGDLGNVEANSHGIAHIDIFDPKASLDPHSKAYIGGRAMVVHAKPDDLGRGGDAESLITGNAGARVGCGIIDIKATASGFYQQTQHPVNIQKNPVYSYRKPKHSFGQSGFDY